MKVILTQDVDHLGSTGDVKEVKNGFARNFLLPRGMAKAATPGAMKLIEQKKAADARKITILEEENKSLADLIAKQTLTIKARVGREGRLYGSITSNDVAKALSEKLGQEIDRRKVELADTIHTVGNYEATVKLVGKLMPIVKVTVVGEGDEEEATEAVTAETETAEVTE